MTKFGVAITGIAVASKISTSVVTWVAWVGDSEELAITVLDALSERTDGAADPIGNAILAKHFFGVEHTVVYSMSKTVISFNE